MSVKFCPTCGDGRVTSEPVNTEASCAYRHDQCARCGDPEFRIHGYCSVRCEELHDVEQERDELLGKFRAVDGVLLLFFDRPDERADQDIAAWIRQERAETMAQRDEARAALRAFVPISCWRGKGAGNSHDWRIAYHRCVEAMGQPLDSAKETELGGTP